MKTSFSPETEVMPQRASSKGSFARLVRYGVYASLAMTSVLPMAGLTVAFESSPSIPPLSTNPQECKRIISGGARFDAEVGSGVSERGEFYAASHFYSHSEMVTTAEDLQAIAFEVPGEVFEKLGFPKNAVVGYSSEVCNWIKPVRTVIAN